LIQRIAAFIESPASHREQTNTEKGGMDGGAGLQKRFPSRR
jgi:hypothetical protein